MTIREMKNKKEGLNMKKYILEGLINKDFVTIDILDEVLVFKRNEDGLWIRPIWGSVAYLTDEELATEISEDYSHLSIANLLIV